MAKRGGRRSKAGRKARGPISGKRANFSTRISVQTRQAMEAEAAASGWSISQAAEKLLELGIETRRERELNDATKALNYLIGRLADEVRLAAPEKIFEWNADAFICDALGIAIGLLIQELRRPLKASAIQKLFTGADGVHPLYREVLASPEAWAKHAFLSVWGELTTVPIETISDRKNLMGEFFDKRTDGAWSQRTYDLDRARRALGFKEDKQ